MSRSSVSGGSGWGSAYGYGVSQRQGHGSRRFSMPGSQAVGEPGMRHPMMGMGFGMRGGAYQGDHATTGHGPVQMVHNGQRETGQQPWISRDAYQVPREVAAPIDTQAHLDPNFPSGPEAYIRPRLQPSHLPNQPLSPPHLPTSVRNVPMTAAVSPEAGFRSSLSHSPNQISHSAHSRQASLAPHMRGMIMPSHVRGQAVGSVGNGNGGIESHGVAGAINTPRGPISRNAPPLGYPGHNHMISPPSTEGPPFHTMGMSMPSPYSSGANSPLYRQDNLSPPFPLSSGARHPPPHRHHTGSTYDSEPNNQRRRDYQGQTSSSSVDFMPFSDSHDITQAEAPQVVTTNAPGLEIPRYGGLNQAETEVIMREMGEMAAHIGGDQPWIYGQKQYPVVSEGM